MTENILPTPSQLSQDQECWNKLIDANIRAGTLACMWCLKAHVTKKVSLAFYKWKYMTLAAHSPLAIVTSPDKLSQPSTVSASSSFGQEAKPGNVSVALESAVALMNRIKTPAKSDRENTGITSDQVGQSSQQYQQSAEENVQFSTPRGFSQEDIIDGAMNPSSSVLTSIMSSLKYNKLSSEHLDRYLRDTLINKDTDFETKRKLLLAMSNDIIDRGARERSRANSPADSITYRLSRNIAGSDRPGGSYGDHANSLDYNSNFQQQQQQQDQQSMNKSVSSQATETHSIAIQTSRQLNNRTPEEELFDSNQSAILPLTGANGTFCGDLDITAASPPPAARRSGSNSNHDLHRSPTLSSIANTSPGGDGGRVGSNLGRTGSFALTSASFAAPPAPLTRKESAAALKTIAMQKRLGSRSPGHSMSAISMSIQGPGENQRSPVARMVSRLISNLEKEEGAIANGGDGAGGWYSQYQQDDSDDNDSEAYSHAERYQEGQDLFGDNHSIASKRSSGRANNNSANINRGVRSSTGGGTQHQQCRSRSASSPRGRSTSYDSQQQHPSRSVHSHTSSHKPANPAIVPAAPELNSSIGSTFGRSPARGQKSDIERSHDNDFRYLKFKNTDSGNYVRELISPSTQHRSVSAGSTGGRRRGRSDSKTFSSASSITMSTAGAGHQGHSSRLHNTESHRPPRSVFTFDQVDLSPDSNYKYTNQQEYYNNQSNTYYNANSANSSNNNSYNYNQDSQSYSRPRALEASYSSTTHSQASTSGVPRYMLPTSTFIKKLASPDVQNGRVAQALTGGTSVGGRQRPRYSQSSSGYVSGGASVTSRTSRSVASAPAASQKSTYPPRQQQPQSRHTSKSIVDHYNSQRGSQLGNSITSVPPSASSQQDYDQQVYAAHSRGQEEEPFFRDPALQEDYRRALAANQTEAAYSAADLHIHAQLYSRGTQERVQQQRYQETDQNNTGGSGGVFQALQQSVSRLASPTAQLTENNESSRTEPDVSEPNRYSKPLHHTQQTHVDAPESHLHGDNTAAAAVDNTGSRENRHQHDQEREHSQSNRSRQPSYDDVPEYDYGAEQQQQHYRQHEQHQHHGHGQHHQQQYQAQDVHGMRDSREEDHYTEGDDYRDTSYSSYQQSHPQPQRRRGNMTRGASIRPQGSSSSVSGSKKKEIDPAQLALFYGHLGDKKKSWRGLLRR